MTGVWKQDDTDEGDDNSKSMDSMCVVGIISSSKNWKC